MAQRDAERYAQGDDGLIVEKVGSWAVDSSRSLPTMLTPQAEHAATIAGRAQPTSMFFPGPDAP